MLLYGPPGTGKTLIARQIGKMLAGREPKIVHGPEILNKFVGQAEENIRNLFADAIQVRSTYSVLKSYLYNIKINYNFAITFKSLKSNLLLTFISLKNYKSRTMLRTRRTLTSTSSSSTKSTRSARLVALSALAPASTTLSSTSFSP